MAMPSVFWILLLLVAALSAAPATAPAVSPATTQPVAPGIVIYRANYCGVCHELPAAGTRGTFGPSHVGIGEIAARRIVDAGYGGTATSAADYIIESLLAPGAYIVPGYATSAHPMPSFAHLSEADIAALVDMLLAQ